MARKKYDGPRYEEILVANLVQLMESRDLPTLRAVLEDRFSSQGQETVIDRLEHAENILGAWPVPTTWEGTRPLYNLSQDRITMPTRNSFRSAEALYATWAHEQAHSTGHSSRLARKIRGNLSGRSREELVAELASVLICYRIRVSLDLKNHASYLKSWSCLFKEGGSKVLFQVLPEARKAADLIAPEGEV